MPLRFPLLLKKRGRRRTGSQRWAQGAEVLYQLMFVTMGAIGTWWLFYDVLIPDWRRASDSADFVQTTCRVVDARVAERPALAGKEYCPELQIEFEPRSGKMLAVWTRHGVGRDGPSYREAEAALAKFRQGEQRPCWYDPLQPDHPDRVLLSRQRNWLPWLVLSIPVSLMVAGVVGLARTVVSTRASPERRSALVRRGVDLRMLELLPAQPMRTSGLPSADPIGDSPGVRLAYRLPMDGAEGWRVLGMAVVCVLWNALAALFVYHLAADYLPVGGRLGLAALAVLVLGAIGWWLTDSLWRDARSVGGVGVTRVELDQHPLTPGARCQGILIQSGQLRTRGLVVALVCEEVATFRQGTDSRTAVVEVVREVLHQERRIEVRPGEPFECPFDLTVPEGAPTSFASPHNEVRWSIEVAVGTPQHPELRRRYRLCVYPTECT